MYDLRGTKALLSPSQDLDPLPDLILRESMTESELEDCKRVSRYLTG